MNAYPIPDEIDKIPDVKTKVSDLKIDHWYGGEVAEILHKGPYEEESATIEKLHKYILDKGYEITGPHEEEYIKGPGFFGKGNPKKYITIIRYEVKRKM